MGRMISPCVGCDFEHKDKNRDECGHCDARYKYASGQPAETPVFDEPAKERVVNKKTCEGCKERKLANLENFEPASRSADGLTKACRVCREKAKAAEARRGLTKPEAGIDMAAELKLLEIAEKKRKAAEHWPDVQTKILSSDLKKECVRCSETLPATTEYFNRSKRNNDGLSGRCKGCESRRKRLSKGRREVFVDLTEFPTVWEKLEDTARDQLRTIEAQAAWIVMEALR